MRVLLLGTGSADRWPNPWCACASCDWARASGALRDRTSALVDDVLLIDPGPDSGGRGADLSRVRTVLITHGHPDHVDPAFLLAWEWAAAAASRIARLPDPDSAHSRPMAVGGEMGGGAWASDGREDPAAGEARLESPDPVGSDPNLTPPTSPGRPALLVAGPVAAVRRCEQWTRPDAPVEFRPLAAGDVLVTSTHEVRALPAAHSTSGGHDYDGTALLFEVTAREARLLYGSDTAALPHADLAGPYDLVLLEQTFGDFVDHHTAHLDLPSFAAEVGALRDAGRLSESGRVVAVHLSHHNGRDLAERLAAVGAEALPDGTTISVGESNDATRRAARRLLVTGGARSGKSHHAEAVATVTGRPVIYVATAGSYPDDPEWTARIAAHRGRRPASWQTIETADVAAVLRAADPRVCVVVDCLTLWLTAVLDRAGWDDPDAAYHVTTAAIEDLIGTLRTCPADVVLVTNEVGSGVVPDQATGRLFRDLLGRTNAALADACPDVTLVTVGIPVALKGTPWPITT